MLSKAHNMPQQSLSLAAGTAPENACVSGLRLVTGSDAERANAHARFTRYIS